MEAVKLSNLTIYILLVVSFVMAGRDIFSSQHCTFFLFPQNEGYFFLLCEIPKFRAMFSKLWKEFLSYVFVFVTLCKKA